MPQLPFRRLPLHRSACLGLAFAAGCLEAPISDDYDSSNQVTEWNARISGLKDAHWDEMENAYVDQRMADIFEAKPMTPSCAVGVVRNGEITYMKTYNGPFANWTYDSVVPVASISKTFTAMAIMRLRDEYQTPLNSTVGSILNVSPSNPGLANTTLLDLLTHRTGIGKDLADYNTINDCPEYPHFSGTDSEMKRWCSSHPRIAFARYQHEVDVSFDSDDNPFTGAAEPQVDNDVNGYYSNLGYAILGAVVDHVSRTTSAIPAEQRGYERFVWHTIANHHEHNGDARSMPSMALSFEWRHGDITPYVAGNCIPSPANNNGDCQVWESGRLNWVAPAAYWSMTIGDLTRFVRAKMMQDILPETTWGDMDDPRSKVDSIQLPTSLNYGLGTVTRDHGSSNRKEYYHGGNAPGHTTLWYLDTGYNDGPADDVGVALACSFAVGSQTTLREIAEDIATLSSDVTAPKRTAGVMPSYLPYLLDGTSFSVDGARTRVASHNTLFVPLAAANPWTVAFSRSRGRLRATVTGLNGVGKKGAFVSGPINLGALSTVDPRHVRSAPKSMFITTAAGRTRIDNASFTFGFTSDRQHITDASFSGTLDMRQAASVPGAASWTQLCQTSLNEDNIRCGRCSDGVSACLDMTWDRLAGTRL